MDEEEFDDLFPDFFADWGCDDDEDYWDEQEETEEEDE